MSTNGCGYLQAIANIVLWTTHCILISSWSHCQLPNCIKYPELFCQPAQFPVHLSMMQYYSHPVVTNTKGHLIPIIVPYTSHDTIFITSSINSSNVLIKCRRQMPPWFPNPMLTNMSTTNIDLWQKKSGPKIHPLCNHLLWKFLQNINWKYRCQVPTIAVFIFSQVWLGSCVPLYLADKWMPPAQKEKHHREYRFIMQETATTNENSTLILSCGLLIISS